MVHSLALPVVSYMYFYLNSLFSWKEAMFCTFLCVSLARLSLRKARLLVSSLNLCIIKVKVLLKN